MRIVYQLLIRTKPVNRCVLGHRKNFGNEVSVEAGCSHYNDMLK